MMIKNDTEVENKKRLLAGVATSPYAPLEKDIQRAICAVLASKGYFFWRSNNATSFKGRSTNKAFTPDGIPDIIVIHRGLFVALEVKRPGAQLRPSQVDFKNKLNYHGGFYYVVTSTKELDSIPQLL